MSTSHIWSYLIAGRKHSGKSSIICNGILPKIIEKNNTIEAIFILSTSVLADKIQIDFYDKYKDKVRIIRMLGIEELDEQGKTKKNLADTFLHIKNRIITLMDTNDEKMEPSNCKGSKCKFLASKPVDEILEKPEKKKALGKNEVKFIIYLDDVSTELKNKWIEHIAKTNRHNRTILIVSTQSVVDISKPVFIQFDKIYLGFALGPNIDLVKERLSLSIPIDEIYHKYSKPYNFVVINYGDKNEDEGGFVTVQSSKKT